MRPSTRNETPSGDKILATLIYFVMDSPGACRSDEVVLTYRDGQRLHGRRHGEDHPAPSAAVPESPRLSRGGRRLPVPLRGSQGSEEHTSELQSRLHLV